MYVGNSSDHQGLCCKLVNPCPKVPKAVPFKELEIDKQSIKMQDKLGAGHFGEVWKGKKRGKHKL